MNLRGKKTMLLILAAAAVSGLSAPAASAGQAGAAEESVKEVRRLNPTSAELILSDGHRMTVDFYAPDIFRLFRDDNGGIRESLNGGKDNYQFSARAVVDRYEAHDMPLGWILPNDGYGAGYGQTSTLDSNILNLKSFGDYARSKGVEIGLWTQSDLHPKESAEALLQRDIVKEVRDAVTVSPALEYRYMTIE